MVRNCDVCQTSYGAKRPSSKYCSERCRKRAQRSPMVAPVVAPAQVVFVTSSTAGGSLVGSTVAELAAVSQLDSSLGQAALLLARRLDEGGMDTGSSVAAMIREHRVTLAEAVASGKVAADPLDQLAAQRQSRLARA